MATTKVIVGIGLALLVPVGVKWVWVLRVGRTVTVPSRSLSCAPTRRAAVLDARLDIYSVNFGEASRHFEAARTALRAANARLTSLSRLEDAKALEAALTRIDEGSVWPASSIRMRTLSPPTRRDPERCALAHRETLTRAVHRRVVERSITCGRRTVHSETDDCNDDGGSTGDHAAAGG